MSARLFEIEADVARRVLTAKVTGYWDLEDTKAYIAEVRAAGKRMGSRGPFDMITNVGNAPPLPREAAEYLEREQGKSKPPNVRRMAYVCESIIGRLQLRRLTAWDPTMAVFTNESDALAWFSEPD